MFHNGIRRDAPDPTVHREAAILLGTGHMSPHAATYAAVALSAIRATSSTLCEDHKR